MRKHIFLFFMFAISFGYAQEYKINFSYDDAGNQVFRDRVCLNCRESSKIDTIINTTEVIAETPKDLKEDDFFEEDSKIIVYPNPVTDILQVEWILLEKKVDQILLFSSDNKQLFHREVNHRLTRLDLDFSQYPSGNYIVLVLYTNNTKQSFKVIKK